MPDEILAPSVLDYKRPADAQKREFPGRRELKMRLSRGWVVPLILCGLTAGPAKGWAANCITQGEMTTVDRDALATIGQQLAVAVINQDMATIQRDLLPAVTQQWDEIRSAIEQSAADVKGGQAQLRNLYLLDASTLTAPSDTQFFCSNANG